jgi:peptide subunit release factor 1 (eRF1)
MLLSTLKQSRHSTTALATCYLKPQQKLVTNARSLIARDLATASNIKNRQTRQDVQKALRSLNGSLQQIPTSKEFPNGLALFAGSPYDPRTHF